MTLRQSFSHAAAGLVHIFKSERNARIHLLLAVLALLASGLLGLHTGEVLFVLIAIMAVFLAEVFNSALERVLDLMEPGNHPEVKIIKDMAAAAVLVAAAGAIIIGLLVFGPRLGLG